MADPYARLAGVYDELVVDPCFASWADFVTHRWTSDTNGVHRVLDVCCGTGLMTAELAARGADVVGVDASPAMLARARDRLGPAVPLVTATLPDLPDSPALRTPFDAMTSTFDGFNYLDPAALRATLHRLAGLLRPGGWLVFDLHAEAMLAYVRDNPVLLGEHDGIPYSVTYVVDEAARTCRSIMHLSAEVTPAGPAGPARSHAGFVEEHRQHLHTDAQVRAAITDAGLRVVAVVDEYTDRPVGPGTLRATWIARAPGGTG